MSDLSSTFGGRFAGLIGDHEVHNDEDIRQRAEVHSFVTLERHHDLTMADSDVEVGATVVDPVTPTSGAGRQKPANAVHHGRFRWSRRRRLVLLPGRDERVADQDADTESVVSQRMSMSPDDAKE